MAIVIVLITLAGLFFFFFRRRQKRRRQQHNVSLYDNKNQGLGGRGYHELERNGALPSITIEMQSNPAAQELTGSRVAVELDSEWPHSLVKKSWRDSWGGHNKEKKRRSTGIEK